MSSELRFVRLLSKAACLEALRDKGSASDNTEKVCSKAQRPRESSHRREHGAPSTTLLIQIQAPPPRWEGSDQAPRLWNDTWGGQSEAGGRGLCCLRSSFWTLSSSNFYVTYKNCTHIKRRRRTDDIMSVMGSVSACLFVWN